MKHTITIEVSSVSSPAKGRSMGKANIARVLIDGKEVSMEKGSQVFVQGIYILPTAPVQSAKPIKDAPKQAKTAQNTEVFEGLSYNRGIPAKRNGQSQADFEKELAAYKKAAVLSLLSEIL